MFTRKEGRLEPQTQRSDTDRRRPCETEARVGVMQPQAEGRGVAGRPQKLGETDGFSL